MFSFPLRCTSCYHIFRHSFCSFIVVYHLWLSRYYYSMLQCFLSTEVISFIILYFLERFNLLAAKVSHRLCITILLFSSPSRWLSSCSLLRWHPVATGLTINGPSLACLVSVNQHALTLLNTKFTFVRQFSCDYWLPVASKAYYQYEPNYTMLCLPQVGSTADVL